MPFSSRASSTKRRRGALTRLRPHTSPGYTVENQVVNFETNLYRVSDGRLVWSTLSRERLELSEAPGERIDPFVRAKGRSSGYLPAPAA